MDDRPWSPLENCTLLDELPEDMQDFFRNQFKRNKATKAPTAPYPTQAPTPYSPRQAPTPQSPRQAPTPQNYSTQGAIVPIEANDDEMSETELIMSQIEVPEESVIRPRLDTLGSFKQRSLTHYSLFFQ